MKCPNCSFNNIASAHTCKICGTALEVVEGANNDTLALDEALKAIFAGKIKTDEIVTESAPQPEEDPWETTWEPFDEDEKQNGIEENAAGRKNEAEAARFDRRREEKHERRRDHDENREEREEKPSLFINPLTDHPSSLHSRDRKADSEDKPDPMDLPIKEIIPVYERTDEEIRIEDQAENLVTLSADVEQITMPQIPPPKRKSKTDEIAVIALVLLILCLIALIYFALKMSQKEPSAEIIVGDPTTAARTAEQSPPVTTGGTTESTSPTSLSTEETTEESTEETSVTTTSKSPFDESYFVRNGSVSGGNGTDQDSLSKVRMGDHLYFHRFVFDFLGSRIPTYQVHILEGGMLIQLHVENIKDFTGDYALTEWNYLAASIDITSDGNQGIYINIRAAEPLMISTYGLEEPGRIVLDLRGESCED